VLKNIVTKKRFRKNYLAAVITALFLIVMSIGMITGHWQNNISNETYLKLRKNINSFGHPRSPDEFRELNELAKSGENDDSKTHNKNMDH
jgi:hypothetical protein